MQTTTRATLIDPTDSNILLTDVLDTEQKFSDNIMQKSFVDEKREIVYVRPLAWLLRNGYLPRESEWTLDKGERKLDGWKPGHMYLYSRYLERNGMPSFPQPLDYCNIFGHDLEHDVEAWENTTGFLAMNDHHRMKAMEVIFLEANQLYDLLPFTTTDKGPMAQAIRLQDMFMATQRRVIAAGPQLEEGLTVVTKAIPRNPDAIRHQETLMRKLITLEERSKYAQPGARDSYWADRFMKSLMRSGATDEFVNEGTRTNTIQKILELQKYSIQGQKITASDVWHAVKTAYVEVNGGEGENLSGMLQGLNTPLTRVMLARPPLGDRNGRDGAYMQTQGRPPDAQKATMIPTIEDAMRTISELRTELAAATNTIVQSKTNSEKFKAIRQANWEKRNAKRSRDENSKPEGSKPGPFPKKAGGQATSHAPASENTNPGARGYCLRTGPASDQDSENERPVENHARLFLLREGSTTNTIPNVFGCEQDAPQSPLPPAPRSPIESPSDAPAGTTEILSIRQRNTRSFAQGIPYDPIRDMRIVDPDMPALIEIDSDNEEVPPIDLYPKYHTVTAHLCPMADSTKTVHDDSTIILIRDEFFLKLGDTLLHTKYMVRGPSRPSQLLREKHAMHCYGLETAADPVQCWLNHCQDPVKQAFRTSIILRSAGVEYDFEVTGPREHLLVKISDLSRPELPPCEVFGTKHEYDDYADACDLAQGTGWAIHLAQHCQEEYYRNIRNLLVPLEARDHTIRMQYDVRYWYNYSTRSTYLLDCYVREITALEQCRANEINFLDAVFEIGSARRAYHDAVILHDKVDISTLDQAYLAQIRYEKTGVPSPFAHVFFVLPTSPHDGLISHATLPWTNTRVEHDFVSTLTGKRTLVLPRPPKRTKLSDLHTQFYPNQHGGPPDWVVVPEGINAIPILAGLSSPVVGSTSLTIPEGCFTDDLLSVVNGESGASVINMGEQAVPIESLQEPAPTFSALLEACDRALDSPGMEVEGLAGIEADAPNPVCIAARETLGPIGPEPPQRKLRDRKRAAEGVRAAEPACAVAQHAGTGPGPTNQG
jgi:hypothetical protein